ncbi:MAG: PTS sugar transporter subunit IIB [Treponema sp.]|jgi:PTS system cellobiose-specific IIB component|nr:PTS sugar transporter subunit IIB [Treponema sp.]
MNILLSCSGGFSSSLVVSKILEASKKQGRTNKVWAVNFGDIEDNIKDADIVLLAPQILFVKEKCEKLCADHNIPMGLISHENYGTCDGERILAQAEKLVNSHRGEKS